MQSNSTARCKPLEERRDYRNISLHCNKFEYDMIASAAAEIGVCTADYLRETMMFRSYCIKQKIHPDRCASLIQTLRQLG